MRPVAWKTFIFPLIAASCLVGCANVKPWEKGALARSEMQSAGPYPLVQNFSDHIYFAREAMHGGNGVQGGGCGCN